MFNLISRYLWYSSNTDYCLHSIFGFDIHKVPLASFCIREPNLSLISELYTVAQPLLALSKRDNKTDDTYRAITKITQDVESLLYKNNYNIEIHPVKSHEIDESLIELISNNQLSILNDKYVFLDVQDNNTIPDHLYDLIFAIQLKNLIPVLNFPEKNTYLTSKNQRLSLLKDRGCAFHIDLLSLTGFFGQKAKNVACLLLQSNQVQFVSFHLRNLDMIKKHNGIKVSKRVAHLLDEQLFVG